MDAKVRGGMAEVLDGLEKESLEATGGGKERIKMGFDYVVCAERKK